MKKLIFISVVICIFLLLAFEPALFSDKSSFFKLVSKSNSFTAGNKIELVFLCNNEKEKPQLFIVHSYGKTILDATSNNTFYKFKIPQNYSEKTGEVSWFLINKNKKTNNGYFKITPNDSSKTIIENYLGPRTILAGKKEFSMMVTVPTDSLDNPKNDDTKVILKYQFQQKTKDLTLRTKDFITWHNIYSPTKSGKMLVSTSCNKVTTKEIETEVYPNLASNFTINYSRNHEFADGNQITQFKTSIIKDTFGNIVSDGTVVSFIIKTNNNMVLKTYGTSINGIATAQILHPDHKDTYSIKGYVTGMAESNTIAINYKPILTTFNYSFSADKRKLTVGPIKSFMNQLVPDGIKVQVKVFNKNKLVVTLQEDSSKGMATFEFLDNIYRSNNYHFEIITLGTTKKTETINYELHK